MTAGSPAPPGARPANDADRRDRSRGPGGPPLLFAILALGGILLGGVVILGGMLTGDDGAAPPPPRATVAPAGEAAAATREILVDALGDARLQVTDPTRPYRPAEPPVLMTAPRRVVQVILPDDPGRGMIVIYELETEGRAEAVGRELTQYLASGPGAIQYPNDARFVVRRVGSTLVFFPWSPALATDERMPEIERVLETVGEGVPGG
jgi:hypothetical protein